MIQEQHTLQELLESGDTIVNRAYALGHRDGERAERAWSEAQVHEAARSGRAGGFLRGVVFSAIVGLTVAAVLGGLSGRDE